MVSGHYENKSSKTTEFNETYNTKQCYHLFKITKILFDVCNEKKISLKELSNNCEKYIKTIIKHQKLNLLTDADLDKAAHSVLIDLIFEGLTICTPTFNWNASSIHYKLNMPTLLQALYYQLYTFSGKLKQCPKCGTYFEVGNRKKIFCSQICQHNFASKVSYDKKKNSK